MAASSKLVNYQVSNREISRQFNLYAELLLLHGRDERLSHLLSGAAYRLRNLSAEIASLSGKEMAAILRPELIKIIGEMKRSGTVAALDELIQLTPPGLFDMMRIKGLGGKKLYALWHAAKIDNVQDLLQACRNRTLTVAGFGAKTQQNIVAAIEAANEASSRYHYAAVAEAAAQLVGFMKRALKTELVSLCGDVRRQTTTVAGIEVIMAAPAEKLKTAVMRRALVFDASAGGITNGYTLDEIPVTIYHIARDRFHEELFRRTGTESHVKKVMNRVKMPGGFASEAAIYKKARLPFIEPALREDVAEWNYAKNGKDLVAYEDILGVVHNHTDWSDGVDSLEDFVAACRDKGYQYCVISDHSKNAHYAGGLKEPDVLAQMVAIDALNKRMTPFYIFKSIECDILVSGELDFAPDLLEQFDMVIISVHQQLKMDEQKATKRLIKAI